MWEHVWEECRRWKKGEGEWQEMVRLGIKGGRRGGEMDERVRAGERREER